MRNIMLELENMAYRYKFNMAKQIEARKQEMQMDNNSHYMIYNILGMSNNDGYDVDLYQNVGRFLYKYVGSFLEEATILCLKSKYPTGQEKVMLENTIDRSPKKIEIDFLHNNIAFEIKWRDATTDGDHIKKEHKRVEIIRTRGYTPVRLMYYMPNRVQAIKIQSRLQELYRSFGGHYIVGNDAWNFIKEQTEIDLFTILQEIARKNL